MFTYDRSLSRHADVGKRFQLPDHAESGEEDERCQMIGNSACETANVISSDTFRREHFVPSLGSGPGKCRG